jgi:predicted Zn-dependent protease
MRKSLGALFALVRRRPMLSTLILLLLLAGGAAASWYGRREYLLWSHRSAAEAALQHFDLEAARTELEACLELTPRDADLLLLAARADRRAGYYDQAERRLNSYQDLQGKATPDGALERALLNAQRGRLGEVEDHLESLLDVHHPDSARILEAMARGKVEVYRLREAGPLWDELLRLEPGNVQALIARGQLLEVVGARKDALASYRAAVEAEPNHYTARAVLAEALARDHQTAAATEQYEALRQRRPHDPAALLGLARAYVDLGRRSDARAVLEELLRERPDDPDGSLEQGKLLLDLESASAAEPLLRRAAEAMPFDHHAQFHYAICLGSLNRAEEAAAYQKRGEAIEADAKKLEEALGQTLKTPGDPKPHLEAGRICMRNGREGEGLRWMMGALQCDPKDRATHEALAEYYERHGDEAAAAEHRRGGGLIGLPLPGGAAPPR